MSVPAGALTAQVPLPGGVSAERVALRARDVSAWASWVPGLRAVVGQTPAVRLSFGGPRPFTCSVRVRDTDDGVLVDLEEGPIAGLHARVAARGDDVRVELVVQARVAVPEILWRSLEQHVLPEALRRLVSDPAVRRVPRDPDRDAPGRIGPDAG